MAEHSSLERDILKCAFYDGRLRVHNGTILAPRTNVSFSGNDYIKAFRSLRAQGLFTWSGHSPEGGELYDLNENGKKEFSTPMKPK